MGRFWHFEQFDMVSIGELNPVARRSDADWLGAQTQTRAIQPALTQLEGIHIRYLRYLLGTHTVRMSSVYHTMLMYLLGKVLLYNIKV